MLFTNTARDKQDEYSILNSKHFIGIHGYMLVYSVSSLPSFEMVQVIREKILNHLVRHPSPLPSSFSMAIIFPFSFHFVPGHLQHPIGPPEPCNDFISAPG